MKLITISDITGENFLQQPEKTTNKHWNFLYRWKISPQTTLHCLSLKFISTKSHNSTYNHSVAMCNIIFVSPVLCSCSRSHFL